MRVFISYSRRDQQAVELLAGDLLRARHSNWLDEALGGGEEWWLEILEQIRRCDVFVLALSNNSLRSRPCMAELDYAVRLSLPVLPVQIGPVDSLRITPISNRQVVDYRSRATLSDAEANQARLAIDLVVAAADLAGRRQPLPDPLPALPPIPYEYLMQLRLALDSPELSGRLQLQILTQLRQALRDEEDVGARRDVVDLLKRFRHHPETTYRNAVDIDQLLAEVSNDVSADAAADYAAGPAANPAQTLTPDSAISGEERASEPSSTRLDDKASSDGLHPVTTPRRTVDQGFAELPEDKAVLLVVAGTGLGALAVGQLAPLSVYESSDTEPTSFGGQALLASSVLLLLLATCGLVAGLAAVGLSRKRGRRSSTDVHHERWGWFTVATALLGIAVVAGVLLRYRDFLG